MNARRRAFVREYAIDHNATQAAIRAGYSAKTAYAQGSALLKNLEVQAALRKIEAKADERATVTLADVLGWLIDIAVNGKSESARVAACVQLGKHVGGFVDRISIEDTRAAVTQYATTYGLDPADLMRRVDELKRAAS